MKLKGKKKKESIGETQSYNLSPVPRNTFIIYTKSKVAATGKGQTIPGCRI